MRNLMRTAAALTASCGLGVAGLVASSQAAIGQPLPASQAGTLVAWGGDIPAATNLGSLEGVDVVNVDASNYGWAAAVKADGSVATWGVGRPDTSGLSNVAAVATFSSGLVALKKDGSVAGIGASPDAHLEDAPTLTAATDVALNSGAAAAVVGGSVQEWGAYAALMPVPDGLAGVTDIAGAGLDFTAVKSDGTLKNWGAVPTPVPGDVDGHATAIAGGQVGAGGSTYAAILTDGSVQAWNADGEIATPSELAGEKVVDVDVNGSIIALTADGKIFSWGAASNNLPGEFPAPSTGVPMAVTAGLNLDGTSFAAAIVTPFKAVTAPTITGNAVVGRTLSATPAAFSLTPDKVTGQWLAGGKAIPGATGTKLTLSTAYLGKTIVYRSAATKGDETVTSDSTPTKAVVTGAVIEPPAPALTPAQKQLAKDQATLRHDQAKLKKAKKALKKAHGAKKAKLKKKVAKLKKHVKADKKHIKADKKHIAAGK